jgi:hypothetical protein
MSRGRVIGGAVAALGVLALVAFLGLDLWVRGAMEDVLSRTFGTEVRVESVDVGLFSGDATAEGVVVSNPEGFESPHFLALADTRARAGLTELWGDTVTVERVELEGLELYLERDGTSTNFGPILGRVRSSGTGESGGRRYRIRELVLRETVARVRLGAGDPEGWTVELPEVRLEDLGTGPSGGIPVSPGRCSAPCWRGSPASPDGCPGLCPGSCGTSWRSWAVSRRS